MKRMFLVGCAMLLAASMVYAQAPTIEEAGEIAVGDTVMGTFEPGGRDRYTLTIGDESSINIFLDGDDTVDTYLRVYRGEDAQPFAENDDRGDGTLYSALSGVEVEPGETLIIEVGTYADEGEGAYTLRVSPPPLIEEAGEIVLTRTLTVNSRQRFNLTIDETTTLSILADGLGDLDTYLRLYSAGSNIPSVQNDDINFETLDAGFTNLVVPGGTELVIEVGAYNDMGSGEFILSVEPVESELIVADEPIVLDDAVSLADVCADAEAVAEPPRLQYFAPEQVLEEGVDYAAVFCTETGAFLTDLYEAEAPITVNSFVYLATNHYFDQTTFHRVIEDFVVQGGDPTGSGYGGPGYEFVNETDNELTFGGIGVLGMANAGPDTNGSQFFITLAPLDYLDGGYTIFGQVLAGMAAVTDIAVHDASEPEPGTALYRVIIVKFPAGA